MAIQEDDRRYPLKRPKGHKVPVPRWTLQMPDGITDTYTFYIGVQSHSKNTNAASRAERSIQQWLDHPNDRPTAVDTFRVTNGFDIIDSKVWVAYWTDAERFSSKIQSLNLKQIWDDLGDEKSSTGLWTEHFVTPIDRLETNYASLLHQPGISQVPGSEFPEHNLTAYWGAGRDRLPASATDLFQPPDETTGPREVPKGIGEHLTGTNYDNMCHIRSGQWWEQCDDVEREAYEGEDGLQRKLMNGMQYLWDNPAETGTIGLRLLQNLDDKGKPGSSEMEGRES
ncbi:uncharacterized protein LTR77_002594 [Saxophila tyrrhenica]|uniref:Uncharacterized protein n=1 Tax=Saxophila tyrrhenica TaxID=1690608 RepID=A0AAV9PK97_9PEZI|nr:hypothetical protein LTR77_002594 [Saxophila tyrrhenica]